MIPHPSLENASKRYPAWDPRELVREFSEASRISPPSAAWLPSSTVPFPFDVKGPFVAGMVRSRPAARFRSGFVAFIPAGVIRAELPILPEMPFTDSRIEIRIPVADAPSVRVSREERRLEQRRRLRADAEAEASAQVAHRLEATEKALLEGGLWRAEDIASLTGLGLGAVHASLEALSASGRAVLVVLGHWRSRARSVDLSENGRTREARLLGHLLHGLSMDADTLARIAGLCPVETDAAGKRLVALAHAIPANGNSVRCPDGVRRDVLRRVGPSILSPFGQRVVDDLFVAAPSRKVDVANRLGVGRGSVNRAIERLVEEGWLTSPAPDLFAVA